MKRKQYRCSWSTCTHNPHLPTIITDPIIPCPQQEQLLKDIRLEEKQANKNEVIKFKRRAEEKRIKEEEKKRRKEEEEARKKREKEELQRQ